MNQERNISDQNTIEAVSFTPSDSHERRFGLRPWHVLSATFVVVAVLVFWFLFTSKSVQLKFSPTGADNVQISGGFAFELGGVYLLREGSYQVLANAELHEPLETQIQVGQDRSQTLDLEFVPLPGFLNLSIKPSDAVVEVDGLEVEGHASIELSAGPHDLLVSHPRFQTQRQIVEIQGRQITQELAMELLPNWADVDVTSSPSGAQIFIDDQDTGMTTPGVIQALAGEREVSVRLDGHKTHRERIFAQAGVALSLAPVNLVQADAQVQITSTPSGAGITLNGAFVGRTPTQLDLKSGQPHRIAIIRNGYDTYTQSLKLARGDVRKLHAPLRLQLGEVVIRSQPAGALLTVDGVAKGAADQVLKLPIKPHEISISLPGHAGYRQTITPKVGLTQEVKVKLLTLAEARLAALKPVITTSLNQNLKLFEPFDFSMGASRREPGRRANETLRDVKMSRLFYIATEEVTNADFRKFASGHDSGSFVEISLNDDDMPVSSVSWNEAAAFCNWLSDRDGLAHFYRMEFGKVVGVNSDAIGYRLPTEAEWAWAARTSTEADVRKQLRFPWGSNLPPPDRQGNYADRAASALVGRVIFGYNDNHTAAAPVGTFKANQRGLYDMGGNVAEWVHDFYAIPDSQTLSDPRGPAEGQYHVIRGSSWMHGTITELRFSFRDYGADGRQDLGFRIARYAE